MADPRRLDDTAVAERLAALDPLLERLETATGPTARTAVRAVRELTAVYGEALARVLDHADPTLRRRLADDELLGHLLVLHAIHPDPVADRVGRAVERLRPALREHGADAEFTGVHDGVAEVRLTATGCGAGAAGEAVRDAVLACAPELSEVRLLPARERAAAFVPLATVTRRPVPARDGT
ncbi:NifU family protein [Streptantibioticus cattleyicolor]|uniref:NIF system FeS cluster assembly NifU C-terminal domain-containing protein n=1 Tax=Streptantibioticus cattleyicolor (strain ATCC 35852 / DSM 46488 / JCM 4925 / NBRC 14057 / NRRL 8057) TaxID=1003195 RepID=F8JM41_STREN|nr:NifU family protein [Streptantibioticus cattleyicolor]AEW99437.1 hypothetical protein SCATT_p12440 [Streptantibioticus cattleyicolor NRRL 8057 = DSM 46488]CCB71523.1 Nitrogen-fixing NifU-like [Streptantibioticus cattleyicolor NRRL 8057 = DSM 46488]